MRGFHVPARPRAGHTDVASTEPARRSSGGCGMRACSTADADAATTTSRGPSEVLEALRARVAENMGADRMTRRRSSDVGRRDVRGWPRSPVRRRGTRADGRRGTGRGRSGARDRVPRASSTARGRGSRSAANPDCRSVFYDRSKNRSGTLVRDGRVRQPRQGPRLPRARARARRERRTVELRLRGPRGEPVDLWRTLVSHGFHDLAPTPSTRSGAHARRSPYVCRAGRPRRVTIAAGRRGDPRGSTVAGPAPLPRLRGRASPRPSPASCIWTRTCRRSTRSPPTIRELAWVATGAGRMLRCPTVWEDVVKTLCTTNCSWGLTRHDGARARHEPRRARRPATADAARERVPDAGGDGRRRTSASTGRSSAAATGRPHFVELAQLRSRPARSTSRRSGPRRATRSPTRRSSASCSRCPGSGRTPPRTS